MYVFVQICMHGYTCLDAYKHICICIVCQYLNEGTKVFMFACTCFHVCICECYYVSIYVNVYTCCVYKYMYSMCPCGYIYRSVCIYEINIVCMFSFIYMFAYMYA